MFQKPFKFKSKIQMRKSDKKTFKAKILKYFPNLSETDIDLIISAEPVHLAKICTHSNNVVTVYITNNQPILFELNEMLYPTVFMLWKVPEMLPAFTIHDPVLPNLVAGADLMLPGLALPPIEGPSKYQKFQKGDTVVINLTSNVAPVAIGTTASSSFDMFMCAGRGKCVLILHCLGDKLCSFEGCVPPTYPELGPPKWINTPNEYSHPEEPSSGVGAEANIKSNEFIGYDLNDDVINQFDDLQINQFVEAGTEINEQTSTDDMDALFTYCFLKTIKYFKKNIVLPVLTSTFYRTLMVSSCPSDKVLNIKQTSYKKLNKFLNIMVDKGIITTEEQSKGIEKIVNINYEHESVFSFMLDKNDSIKYTNENETDVGLNVAEMLTVTGNVLPIFKHAYLRKGDSVKSTDVRKIVTDYVKGNNLLSPENPRLILPNEDLTRLMGSQRPIPWEDVMQKVYEAMGVKFSLTTCDGQKVTGKGKISPITMSISCRSGNKKVTFVKNLELYGIKLTEFAKECQHGVAASTSISKIPGNTTNQLLVQGNQVLFIGNLLQNKYKIPKKFISGLELAPKNKK